MPHDQAYSYRAVRRGLIHMLGGPSYTREIYSSAGRRRLLSGARRGTLAPEIAISIASISRRQRVPAASEISGVDSAEIRGPDLRPDMEVAQ